MVAEMIKNIIIASLCGIVFLLLFISCDHAVVEEGRLGYHLHYHSFVDSFYVVITVKSRVKEFDKLQVFYRLERQGRTIREGSGTLLNSRSVSIAFEIADKDSVIRTDGSSILVYWGIGRDGLFKRYYLLKPQAVFVKHNCSRKPLSMNEQTQKTTP